MGLMREEGLRIVIVAPGYAENSGGCTALHLLCHRINSLGIKAVLWHYKRPFIKRGSSLQFLKTWLQLKVYQIKRKTIRKNYFPTNTEWITPEIDEFVETKNDWVIYPDNIYTNILEAKRIVRWIMYRTPLSHYSNEHAEKLLIYFYSLAYSFGAPNPKILACTRIRFDLFNKETSSERYINCHIFRKNDSGAKPFHSADSICLDGMTNEEMAKHLKKAKIFISYDLYTMHSIHASMCGCISIVAPKAGLGESDWLPDVSDRYGIAYGLDRVEWAQRTAPLLLERLKKTEVIEHTQLQDLLTELGSSASLSA